MLLLFPLHTCDIVLCVLPSPLECQLYKGRNLHPLSLLCPWHPTGSQCLCINNQGVQVEGAHGTQLPGTTPHRLFIKTILN